MLVALTDAHSEAEAEMICARLAAEGVEATFKREIGTDLPEVGAGALHEIYVEEADLARARTVISSPGFSERELSALSEGEQQQPPAAEPDGRDAPPPR